MRRAIELRPDEPRYRMLLGDTLAEAHAWDEAATAYAAVPATAPQYYESLLALASVERDRGQPQQSFTTLSRAILADADRSEGYEQMAVLLAAVPDQSIRNLSRAQQAAELALARADAPDERARALDAIGIVYAADGDFVTAETYAREALRLSPSDDTKLSNAIESRIAQYRQRRAFILPRVAVNPAQASGDLDPLRAS
jgi:tetratricopeptide (TPR) repeat protein